jgi:hypothetical protein
MSYFNQPIEEKIERFAQYLSDISSKMTYSQKNYCKRMIEDILTLLREKELVNDNLESKLAGTDNYKEYLTNLDKAIAVIQCFDIPWDEYWQIEKREIDFILLHKDTLKKQGQITPTRFLELVKIYRFFFRTECREPNSLKELTDKFYELKQLRKQD